ncbi:sentrin-specific protease 1-like isoform X3 [Hoplias malabaricus]|uniref:sentrin-specific protease 1-like isoform X3 n=1 Tax=Hoplias malabaricus TaxID=27720 RepID=UPI003461E490
MGVDIEKWVSQCKNCQLSRVTLKQEPVHIPITVHSPFELVGMDLIGKLTMTTRGNQYICVMIDYYTKWTEAFAIPNKTAEKVTECIVQFFYRFGAPKRILTDQGKEFVPAAEHTALQGQSSPVPAAEHTALQGQSSPVPKEKHTEQALQPCFVGSGTRNTSLDRIHNSVQAAWSGKNCYVLLSKVGPYKIFYSDIERFGPEKELESEVINAYITILVKQHNERSEEEAFLVDSFDMTAIWNSEFHRIKWDPSRYKIILGVVNDQHHWFLVVMYPNKRKTLLLDSKGESELKLIKCLERTRAFMRKKGIEVSRWTCETVLHPVQQDGTSCGVFALKFADQVLAAKPLTFPSDTSSINALRWDMAVTLLRESDDISNLCHVCGETATNDKSAAEKLRIACDRCGRWFHTSCVDNPALDKEYMCTACV